jgi:uncharacterized membrane protein YdjX (TVP38/TMEM64 family)
VEGLKARGALRLALLGVVLLALWLGVRQLPLLRWVVLGAELAHRSGLPGALLAAFAIYLLTLLFLPIVPLVLAAGWVYGLWGAAIGLVPAVASAATAFSVARFFGRSAAAQALLQRPRTRALAELAEQGGVFTVILIRVSPVLPYTPSNAVMGLTAMRLRDLVIGTAVGMAPGTLLYAWAGSLLPSAEAIERGEGLHGGPVWALLALGTAAAAIMGVAAARKLRSLRRR